MKDGLLGDVATRERHQWYVETNTGILDTADVEPIFRALTDEQRSSLHRGFGADVASLFKDATGVTIEEEWLGAEIPHQDRHALFQSIFDRI